MNATTARRLAAAAPLGLASATVGGVLAEPVDRPPSVADTLAAVRQIAHELKRIDERLGKLEESLASVDASLKPVGALAQPAELRGLILLATACGEGLIILHAALRRWFARPPGRWGRNDGTVGRPSATASRARPIGRASLSASPIPPSAHAAVRPLGDLPGPRAQRQSTIPRAGHP